MVIEPEFRSLCSSCSYVKLILGTDACDGVAADSLDWFKIGEASWDGTEWPSDKIRRDQDWTFTIPADIAPG